MATLQAIRVVGEEGRCQSPRSPEARLGMKVEDLWDGFHQQGAQLTPTEKLNACFEGIPLSAFPPCPSSQVIEIRSDASLAEAVRVLSEHRILGAPVFDVDAPEDASWMEKYIGIVEFAGIVVWILYQSEPPSPRSPKAGAALAMALNGVTSVRGLGLGPEPAAATPGSFFEALITSEIYKNTKVQEISGSFRWAPFLALQKEDSFLTMLLLLSKYKMKSIPVVDEGKIDNIITQSAVIHMLAECAGLHWFEDWGMKTLSQLDLPLMTPDKIVKVYEDEPVLQAFKLMRKERIGGIPIVDASGRKAVGNISLRDICFLLTAPEIYHDCRLVTAKGFVVATKGYLEKKNEVTAHQMGDMVTCKRDNTMKELILMLDSKKIHRLYVIDDEGNLEGVLTLRDIISKLVHEPRGYFGDFFDGVLPLPPNSRV
ncbi:hypothetical protein SAY87_028335 [Trapa incisa]|uniref:CBS domain-containing protein n=2 Tax=Trapa TaxID=22665 RepID=A0AAN7MZD4_TRANT|nr:hypothetical protein SAY87_028335 [Trapa incisa]KAK4801083.1 hypothetical protein SAY86_021570 [Trapa natans]